MNTDAIYELRKRANSAITPSSRFLEDAKDVYSNIVTLCSKILIQRRAFRQMHRMTRQYGGSVTPNQAALCALALRKCLNDSSLRGHTGVHEFLKQTGIELPQEEE